MRILRFDEAKLDIEELRKRGDVLVDKLKKQVNNPNDPEGYLTFTKGNFTIVGTASNANDIIDSITDGPQKTFDMENARNYFTVGTRPNYIQRFQVHQDLYKLNDIEKTVDFGSSGGTSLGTKNTIIVECIQCLFCALRNIKRKEIKLSDYDSLFDLNNNNDINPLIKSKVKIPIKLNRNIVDSFTNDWYENFIFTANALFEKRPLYADKSPQIRLRVRREKGSPNRFYTVLNDNLNYIFYHNGYREGITEKIRNKYNSFENCKSVRIEKWNPSDIWAIIENQEEDIAEKIEKVVDNPKETPRGIEILNQIIDDSFQQKILTGISLKKVKTLVQPTLLINKVTPRPRYRFLKVRTSGTAMNSQGLHIILEQISTISSECRTISINLRTFESSRVGNISGEVIGTTARHGKISLGWINKIFSKFYKDTKINIGSIETHQDLDYVSDDDLLSEIEYMNDVIKDLGDATKEVDSSIEIGSNKFTRKRLVSKYQALRVAMTLYEMNYIDKHLGLEDYEKYSDVLCQELMYYALAIRNDIFTCPIYVRVI